MTNSGVPFWLRGMVSKTCKREPFKSLGASCYLRIANLSAKSLLNLQYAEAVFLRGKKADKSNPGISDLDFWMFIKENEISNPNILLKLRTKFKKLKSYFLLLGKLEVTSPDSWEIFRNISPASFLQDLPLHRFVGAEWEKEMIIPARHVRSLSRFNQGMLDYARALSYLPTTQFGNSAYYQNAVFAKCLNKVIDFARGDQFCTHQTQANYSLLAEAFMELHRLALQAESDQSKVIDLQLTIKETGTIQVIQESDELQRLNEIRKLFKAAGFLLTAIPQTNFMYWDLIDSNLEDIERFFILLLQYYRSVPARTRHPDHFGHAPVTVLSPHMFKCMWRGAFVGPLLENLNVIPNQFLTQELFLNSIKTDIFMYFYERLVTRLNHNLGVVVSYSPEKFIKPLLYQCIELLIVYSRHITNDLELLCDLSSTKLPFTTKWLKRLLARKFPLCHSEWVEAFIQVRSESISVLNDSMKVLA